MKEHDPEKNSFTKESSYSEILEELCRSDLNSGMLQETLAEYRPGKRQGEYTLEDYRALPDNLRVELIDGVLFYMEAPHAAHQTIAFELSVRFREYILKNGGKCRTWATPVNVQLDCDEKTMVQPDVVILCDKNKIQGGNIVGAPDLVVEVLSDSTARKDMILKKEKYRRAGVREYWMVDRQQRRIVVCAFEKGMPDRIYGPDEEVPVGIYDGRCTVSFREIFDYAEEW